MLMGVYNDVIVRLTMAHWLWTCMNELLLLLSRGSQSEPCQNQGHSTSVLLKQCIYLRNNIIQQYFFKNIYFRLRDSFILFRGMVQKMGFQQTRHVFSPVQQVLIWLRTGAKNIFEFFQYFQQTTLSFH